MRSALALLGVILACPLAMRADSYTYTYTGPNFTTASGPYTTSDSISGFFSVDSPLAPNLSYAEIYPVSFSFSDGVNTITNTSANIYDYFYALTDAKGNITTVEFLVGDGPSVGSYPYTNMIYSDLFVSGATEGIYEISPGYSDVGGAYANTSGSFSGPLDSPALSPTPEPSSLLLLGTGLTTMAGFVWRRRKSDPLCCATNTGSC